MEIDLFIYLFTFGIKPLFVMAAYKYVEDWVET